MRLRTHPPQEQALPASTRTCVDQVFRREDLAERAHNEGKIGQNGFHYAQLFRSRRILGRCGHFRNRADMSQGSSPFERFLV